MRKKLFGYEYFLEGFIVAAAATNYFSPAEFVLAFLALFALVYWREGLQPTTFYYIPIAAAMLIGQALEIQHTNAYACVALVGMQYTGAPVYNLPTNKKLVGVRKSGKEGEECFELYPLAGAAVKRSISWDQGSAFQKVIESKQATGIVQHYHRLSLSYIRKMAITVGEGEERPTQCGMAFCHGRDAAPFWYSSLLIHFASNNFKVGARQHASLARMVASTKEDAKKCRQAEARRTAEEYYSVIGGLSCEKLVLVGHSFGCSALLRAYHEHSKELSSKVTHIVLLDPYLFPLPDDLLLKPVSCPMLVLANEYLLNFEDVNERLRILTSQKNAACVVWKGGADLFQTDLCFFFTNGSKEEEWQSKFQLNLEAINAFMLGKQVEGVFGDRDLGREYKPEQFYPEHLFIF